MMKVNSLFFVTDFVLHAKSCPVVYILFLPATWRPPCCCCCCSCVTCKNPLHHKDLCAIFSRLRITKNSAINNVVCILVDRMIKLTNLGIFFSINLQANILFKEFFFNSTFFQIVTYCVLTRQSIKKVTSGLASKLTVCCCCCF